MDISKWAKAGIAALFIVLFTMTSATAHHPPNRVVKVAKHIVAGSGVTTDSIEKQFEKAKQVWAPHHIDLVQVKSGDTTVDSVASTTASKVAGAINIYGVDKTTYAKSDKVPVVYDQDNIQMPTGPKTRPDSLAHELGHWFDAIPDNRADVHGDHISGQGMDMDGNGVVNATDTSNVMYPGNMPAGEPTRTGQNLDAQQHNRVGVAADRWIKAQDTIKKGAGNDASDTIGDVPFDFIDLRSGWAWSESTKLYLKLISESITTTVPSRLGFLINSDNSTSTGEAPFGFDYRLEYDPMFAQTQVWRFIADWSPADSTGITSRLVMLEWDALIDPEPIGVELDVPTSLLGVGSGDTIGIVGFAEAGPIDFMPDVGLGVPTILIPPGPPPTGGNTAWLAMGALILSLLGGMTLWKVYKTGLLRAE